MNIEAGDNGWETAAGKGCEPGGGVVAEPAFVTTNATLAGVVVTDDLGNVVFTGN